MMIATIVLLIGNHSFSQNCKNLKVNKVDEFTGEQIKVSQTRIFKKGGYEEGFFQIDKTSETFKRTFIYNNSDRRFANAGVFGCRKGDKIFIMLDNNSVLKLNLIEEFYSSRTESARVGTEILLGSYAGFAKSNKIIFEPEYSITLPDLDILTEKKILKIRIEASGTKGTQVRKLKI